VARNRYLTRDAFSRFLAEREDQVVGLSRHSRQCPVSTFLEHVTNRTWHTSPLNCVPQVDAEPGEDQLRLRHEFKPPRWARDFIYALDGQYARGVVAEVTGRDALYVLNEVA
jgi:hypothetical protein